MCLSFGMVGLLSEGPQLPPPMPPPVNINVAPAKPALGRSWISAGARYQRYVSSWSIGAHSSTLGGALDRPSDASPRKRQGCAGKAGARTQVDPWLGAGNLDTSPRWEAAAFYAL